MTSYKHFIPSLAIALTILIASPTRAGEFKDETTAITLHVPDSWKKSAEKETEAVMKLTLQTGVPEHSDDYYVLKLGHITIDEDGTLEQFKDSMVTGFPADWKKIDVTKATVGKEKLPALHIAYSFTTAEIPFRMDMYLFKRGKQFTFFQFVGTQKAFEAMHEDLHKIVQDADIDPAGGK